MMETKVDSQEYAESPRYALPHARRSGEARAGQVAVAIAQLPRAHPREIKRPPEVHPSRRPAVRQCMIHIGHAVNKILKRHGSEVKEMGFDAVYVPGLPRHADRDLRRKQHGKNSPPVES